MDYKKLIIEMIQKITSEKFLRGIYFFVKTLLEMEDKETMEEKKVFEPLATEIVRDYRKELQEELESLDVFEEEIAKIQKQLSTLQKLIRIDKSHIKEIIGEQEV